MANLGGCRFCLWSPNYLGHGRKRYSQPARPRPPTSPTAATLKGDNRRWLPVHARIALALVVLMVPVAGCLGSQSDAPRSVNPAEIGYDADLVHVDGVRAANYTVTAWDGNMLSAVAIVPWTNDTIPGAGKHAWPVVIFLHGWGDSKGNYAAELERFGQAGFIAIAYDARGFGESGGNATVAGPADQSDLGSIIKDAREQFGPVGHIGVVGQSYGGGQALLAWANNADVATVVSHYGWTDLAGGLIPANVPKIGWAQALYGYGLVGAKGRYDPAIHDWYQQAYTRENLDAVRKQMDDRSVVGHMAGVTKPIFVCQGMQESLFPQIDTVWRNAGGFVRAYVYQGGHGSNDEACWTRTLDWFKFFLAGFDTRVDTWPALETVDASGLGGFTAYAQFPDPPISSFRLRTPDLYEGPASAASFTIRQTLVGNPANDPSVLWDGTDEPNQFLPDGVRADPTSVTFTASFDEPTVLLGAPKLALQQSAGGVAFQVTATISRVRADGQSQILTHAAAAPLDAGDAPQGQVELQFHWVRAAFEAGDHLVLRVASNDPSWWMPLLADYQVSFDGRSVLELPLAK